MIKVKGWELSCFRFHEEMIDSKFMFQNVPKSLNFCTTCSDRGSSLIRKYPDFFFAAETFFLLQVSLEKPRFLVSCDLFTPPKNLIGSLRQGLMKRGTYTSKISEMKLQSLSQFDRGKPKKWCHEIEASEYSKGVRC